VDAVGGRARAKQEIDALEPNIAPVDLEQRRIGAHFKPNRPETREEHLPEFVGTLRMDEWKLMQRPQIGSTEHFR
jgi:hypothetical protein